MSDGIVVVLVAYQAYEARREVINVLLLIRTVRCQRPHLNQVTRRGRIIHTDHNVAPIGRLLTPFTRVSQLVYSYSEYLLNYQMKKWTLLSTCCHLDLLTDISALAAAAAFSLPS